MLKVLVDTNVLVDFCLLRQPWCEDAVQLMRAAAEQRVELVVPATSLKDVAYLVAKNKDAASTLDFVAYLMDVATIGAVTPETCKQALDENQPDFEDSLIAAVAREQAVDVIVSRDAKAFAQACAPKMDPHAFVAFFLQARGDALFFEMDGQAVRGLPDVN